MYGHHLELYLCANRWFREGEKLRRSPVSDVGDFEEKAISYDRRYTFMFRIEIRCRAFKMTIVQRDGGEGGGL